jgi:hypothetical protein
MPWTSADLAKIDAAILTAAEGKSATFGGRSWTSQDLSELRALRAEIAQEIAQAEGRGTSRLAATRKGTW